MFEKCANCSSRVLVAHRGPQGTYCSAQCRAWHAFPGFCRACVDATVEEPAGSTFTFNGIGTKLYGRGKRCPECGSVQQTQFFCVLYIPVVPLKKYRVKWVTPTRFVGRRLDPAKSLELPTRPA